MVFSRFVVLLLLTTILAGGVMWYVHRRTAQVFRLGRRGKGILTGVFAFGVVGTFGGRLLGYAAPTLQDSVVEGVVVAGASIVLAVVISGALLLAIDIIRSLLAAGMMVWRALVSRRAQPRAALARTERKTLSAPLGRRQLLVQGASGAAVLAGAGCSVYGSLFGRYDYEVEEVPIRLDGLAPELDGYTLVQLSDLHFGAFAGMAEIASAEALVRSARADLIVITGDLVDHNPQYAPMVGELVHRLGRLARDGVAVVAGNHDYYTGIGHVLGAARRAGGWVLHNESRVVGGSGGFALVGVDDYRGRLSGRGPDLDRALSRVPAHLPRVLLCHNPSFFRKAAGRVQLQLSGHTHGGQVNVLVQPGKLVLPHGWVAGRYTRKDSVLWVNRGFGTAGPPSRVGAAPEVTRVVLTSA